MKKFTAVLLSVLLLASSLPISAMAAEASGVSEAVAADIVKTEPETTDSVTQPIENTTTAEKTAVDEKPTEATPAKAAEPVGAKQEEKPVGKSSFTYTVANNQVTITGLSDEYLTDLVIPKMIEDLPVTAIKDNAFNGCSQITSITVPNSVTTIGGNAFKGTNPTKITLPFIGNSRTARDRDGVFGFIFGYTDSSNTAGTTYQSWYYYYIPKTIKEVVITDDSRIPASAFCNCDWIEEITIHGEINQIGSSAFYNCSSLKEFNIPESVATIESHAFYNCTSLQSVSIPDEVNTFAGCLFYNCLALEEVNFPAKLQTISSEAFYN